MNDDLMAELHALAKANDMLGKGFLGLALVITERAQTEGLPLDSSTLMTKGGGQVKGAGGARVARILSEYGIARRLSSEGGRTSRGTPAKMRAYVEFLNRRHNEVDLTAVMGFWIDRVRDFFASQPFTLELDPTYGVRGAIRSLIAKVEERQKEMAGATLVGSVVQHLVAAKIETVLGLQPGEIVRHGASVNDAKGRGGDIEFGDTVVHVTTAPGQLLVEKCGANLAAGRRPIIVTGRDRVSVAEGLIDDNGHRNRIDVLDYEQFLAANIFEIGRFEAKGRREAFEAIVDRYNNIVEEAERDPSLRIVIR
jgi:hypothetical protein